MAKVFAPPSTIKKPELNFADFNAYKEDNERYINELKEALVKRKNGKNVGEIIRFPVADGYAEYMVASMRPLELVHLPLYDAWHYEYIERLTAADVEAKIQQQNNIKKLFASKSK